MRKTPNDPGTAYWRDHVMVAVMDEVGVHGAIFIPAFSMYRYNASYAVEAQCAQGMGGLKPQKAGFPPSFSY